MRYAFVAKHRPIFSVHAMCHCLRILPSGFYAWLKKPLSKRAAEDVRQTELIKDAWEDSGKVYGYRKLHDDLCDAGGVNDSSHEACINLQQSGHLWICLLLDKYSQLFVSR